ncbi:hypothetical protein B4U79_09361 [Dinothrombium tinctorium]|uniref:Uncharacterized protein n=1 Tax=Dinothrombium tinctorium TaxID=1965070 RepID=A0A443RDQ1_9ACAR|nr:hypothetical protein B4U79_13442 [Dinothrombium tinctorium]RWS13393.1 hypothetical protein B4U79_09361 [Dinothrombium tinctorium]
MDASLNSTKYQDFVITVKDVNAFKRLLDETTVKEFFEWDRCSMLADKYLIAMALAYFKRACFTPRQYTPFNFFVALYLGHDMEEDDLDLKNDLIRFAISEKITEAKVKLFLRKRDKLWEALQFRTAVNRLCCEELMKICLPTHSIWRRSRQFNHGGVNIPFYIKENVHRELHLTHSFSYSSSRVRCIVCEAHRYLSQKQLFRGDGDFDNYKRQQQCYQNSASNNISKTRSIFQLPRILSEPNSLHQTRVSNYARKALKANHYPTNFSEIFVFEE